MAISPYPKEILVITYNHRNGRIWRPLDLSTRDCSCPFHLYDFLEVLDIESPRYLSLLS